MTAVVLVNLFLMDTGCLRRNEAHLILQVFNPGSDVLIDDGNANLV